jgi:hypothetical protein
MAHLMSEREEETARPALHDWIVRVAGEDVPLRLQGVRFSGASQLKDNPVLFTDADGAVVFQASREAVAYVRRDDAALTVCPYCPADPGVVTNTEPFWLGTPSNAVVDESAPQPCQPSREGGMCGCGEPDDGPAVRLPADMANPGYVRYHLVTDEWAEAFPGLEYRLQSPGDQFVMFRLTPPDGA